MIDIVAALDGGGTKTLGAWADRSGRVWHGTPVGGCNPQDNPGWAAALHAALVQFPAVAQAALGLPGYGEISAIDRDMSRLARSCISLTVPALSLILLNDVELAYHGAFPDGGGVLILAGTGSMAMARGDGGLQRVGGWGDLFGDEGSAYWIGRRGLQSASRMLDGRMVNDGFAGRLASKLGIAPEDGPFGLSAWVLAGPHPRSRIASVSQHINDLSVEGDITSGVILDQAAMILAAHATAVAGKAGLLSPWHWAQAGSVFRSGRILAGVGAHLRSAPIPPHLDALGGGLWLAAKSAGWPVDRQWAACVNEALRG